MNIEKLLEGAELLSFEGLMSVFRFGISRRANSHEIDALLLLENRLSLGIPDTSRRGSLEDACRFLEALDEAERFQTVLDLIVAASTNTPWPESEFVKELVEVTKTKEIVRFSFTSSMLPCLMHAFAARMVESKTYRMYAIRYAGIENDVPLMALASIFLELPIYVESGPPWNPDPVLDDSEPNNEEPDLEVSLPPEIFTKRQAPHLKESVKSSQLPRAVDRGKFDIESVMLQYLGGSEAPAMVFVSKNFVTSTKQSRLAVRRQLLETRRIIRVAELGPTYSYKYLIEFSKLDNSNDHIHMAAVSGRHEITLADMYTQEHRGSFQNVSIEEIQHAGSTLLPSRFLGKGPVGGDSFVEILMSVQKPAKLRLADLFKVIRPKTIKNDPVGDFDIQEVRAGDISRNGEITGASRKLRVRETLAINLEEQKIKSGDILFAHRSPIGHVAYVTDQDIQNDSIWAAQALMVLRPRVAKSSSSYCDPKVLFMYLLTAKVQASWAEEAVGQRSPAIPIERIERFAIPNNLLANRASQRKAGEECYADQILALFQIHQEQLAKAKELQNLIEGGLKKVWKTAWTA